MNGLRLEMLRWVDVRGKETNKNDKKRKYMSIKPGCVWSGMVAGWMAPEKKE